MYTKSTIITIALLTTALVGWQWWERRVAWEQGRCFGIPKSAATDLRRGVVVMNNTGFSLGYSELFANPLWVSYRLDTPQWPAPEHRPDEGFQADHRSIRSIRHDAYYGTGYQRGHMAPNYAMYRVHGPEAQHDSFLMTNIVPQLPNLNQKAWQRLEEVIMDALLPANGPLCVITGPIFGKSPYILPSGVAVPGAFYKLVISGGNTPKILAFRVPQKVNGTEPLTDFLVAVDEIEAATGLDFLTELEKPVEQEIERQAGRDATLSSAAKRPPRY